MRAAIREASLFALLFLALAASAPPPTTYAPATAEECRVIDAAVGSAPATTLAVPPEQIVPPGDPNERAIFDEGHPRFARGQPTADISFCLRANRPHDPIPGSDISLIVSRAAIDEASGAAAVLYDRRCGAGGVIRLIRDRNGDWIRSAGKQMWEHVCDPPPVASRPHR
jgi:hypothetical protein